MLRLAIPRHSSGALLLVLLACGGGSAGPAGPGNPPPPGGAPGVPDLGPNASFNGYVPFPGDNPWNTRVDQAPVDPASDRILTTIGLDRYLHPDFGTNPDYGIPYVVVAGSTPKVAVSFDYSDESDPGPYPIPANPPIEGGSGSTGDRHVLILDRDHHLLYELYAAYHQNGGWHAGSGAIFDLASDGLRPAGWTSADAAGLPILPGLVRYDEVAAGSIPHAIRFTVRRSRQAYVFPARHWASSSTNDSLPPMGMRVRLKAGYDISGFPPQAQVILQAFKTYGMIVADNGSDWFFSGTSDPRWDDAQLNTLKQVPGRAFEVVEMGTVVGP
jgi:hypothetical protein